MSRDLFLAILCVIIAVIIVLFIWGCNRTFAAPLDTDKDGCSDAEEDQFGMNPNNPYDFFDVPPKDGSVDLMNDIFAVAFKFGLEADKEGYYPGFDRSVTPEGLGPPNGSIDLMNDIFAVAFQFGRVCDDVPWCGGNIVEMGVDEKILDGTVKDEKCYAVRDEAGNVVDYLIAEDDTTYEVTGESQGLPPGDLPLLAGISWVGEGETAAGPSVLRFSCEKQRTWNDLFNLPIYKIEIRIEAEVLRNAGPYTGLVNVTFDRGDQRTWAPWNSNGTPTQWRQYVYNPPNGPWDAKIRVHRDVPVRAGWFGFVVTTKTIHATMSVGDGCYWRSWD